MRLPLLFALLLLSGCRQKDTDTTTDDTGTPAITDTATDTEPPTDTATDTEPPTDTAPGEDADGDGYSDDDCDDSDAAIHPDADEVCDQFDNDCDGGIDEDDAVDAPTWYLDDDGDGYGTDDSTQVACAAPHGYAAATDDCDDTDPAIHPGASETDCTDPVDYNCDGSTGYDDVDRDGVAACEDCDDTSAYHYPGAPERCEFTDEDCDGEVDEDAIDATTFYGDSDGDGHGGTTFTVEACETPEAYVESDDDCDDLDATAYPGGTETCDDADNDCDGDTDEGVTTTFWLDDDGDGYGDADTEAEACSEPTGYSPNDDDCDDSDPSAWPGGIEVCDDVDNDCDGDVDTDALDADSFFADTDEDGFGDPDSEVEACDAASGFVDNDDDCDDNDDDIHPDADELCDGSDNNCDGKTDEDDATDADAWYRDADSDGYGDGSDSTTACAEPAGYISDDSDCDDTDAASWPGASESCDAADNDCDLDVDEDATDATAWYLDSDGDGYGDAGQSETACDAPSDHVSDAQDCDDDDAGISPAAVEVCDGTDNDCDGTADGSDSFDADTLYRDADGDGYGDASDSTASCDTLSGYIDNSDDCDDVESTVNPGADEVCDGSDNDCDGTTDDDEFVLGDGEDCPATSCEDVWSTRLDSLSDGSYWIDPDGAGAIEVTCDMGNGGYTLCAALTKGYVPADMLYNTDAYAFQARKNGTEDYAYETDAPAREDSTWSSSEELNFGQFCRAMGTGVGTTVIQAKMWNAENNQGSALKGTSYDLEKEGEYSGNLYLDWFTNSTASRSFSHVSGDQLTVTNDNNGYGGPYVTPNVGWTSSNETAPYTHSTNPWGSVSGSTSCTGCTDNGTGYDDLPYGQTTILNDLDHSFWSGISDVEYGWSDCTADGNCNYEESGFGVWLFWVK